MTVFAASVVCYELYSFNEAFQENASIKLFSTVANKARIENNYGQAGPPRNIFSKYFKWSIGNNEGFYLV